jgi:hypothetical protein
MPGVFMPSIRQADQIDRFEALPGYDRARLIRCANGMHESDWLSCI